MKKQNITNKITSKDFLFFFILALIIIVCFVLLIPKAASSLLPKKQDQLLLKFISDIQKSRTIELRKYWEFREFYSPGYFIYEKNGLTNTTDKKIVNFTKLDKLVTPELLFTSAKVISVGGRTSSYKIPPQQVDTEHIILKTSSELITETNRSYTIIFLKPISIVKKANGFLQNETKADMLHGNYWLELTIIQKN